MNNAEGADLIADGKPDRLLILLGIRAGAVIAAAGSIYYDRKDINA